MLPNAVCRQRAFSLRTALFLFRLTKYNGVGSRKPVCWFLHYIMKSGQMILIVPQRFCCLPPMMTSQSDTSRCVHQGFHCGDFSSIKPVPSDLQINASDSPRLTQGGSWCLEQINPNLPTPTLLLWCHVHPSYKTEL